MTGRPESLLDTAHRLRSGDLTSRELTDQGRRLALAVDGELGAYLTRFDDAAGAAAGASDARSASGRARGRLDGITVGVKDVIATREAVTTGQSLVPGVGLPAGRDAAVVARLRAAGVVVTGKTTTSELALGAPDPTKPFPLPRNPWDLSRWPGGSSAGSAAGVAAGLFVAAVASDTGGSTRVPAAFCGVTGFVPTYGIVPTDGLVRLAHSFDRIGVIARGAADCRLLIETMGRRPGHTAADSSGGWRVGAVDEVRAADDPDVHEAFRSACDALAGLHMEVSTISLPMADELASATRTLIAAEAFAEYRDALATHRSAFYRTTRARLDAAALMTADDLHRAEGLLTRVRPRLDELFTTVDVVVSPTIGTTAPRYDAAGDLPEFDVVLRSARTAYWSAFGAPAISVPIGLSRDGLPMGMQIAAAPGNDVRVLAVAEAYQAATDWHRRTPEDPGGRVA